MRVFKATTFAVYIFIVYLNAFAKCSLYDIASASLKSISKHRKIAEASPTGWIFRANFNLRIPFTKCLNEAFRIITQNKTLNGGDCQMVVVTVNLPNYVYVIDTQTTTATGLTFGVGGVPLPIDIMGTYGLTLSKPFNNFNLSDAVLGINGGGPLTIGFKNVNAAFSYTLPLTFLENITNFREIEAIGEYFYHSSNYLIEHLENLEEENFNDEDVDDDEISNTVEIDRNREPRMMKLQPEIIDREVERLKLISKLGHILKASQANWWNKHFELPEEAPLSQSFNVSECLLKFLCEGGHNRGLAEHEDVITELVHMLLTPEDVLWHLPAEFDDVAFVEAQKFGSGGGNCDEKYPFCHSNFFEYFEDVEETNDDHSYYSNNNNNNNNNLVYNLLNGIINI